MLTLAELPSEILLGFLEASMTLDSLLALASTNRRLQALDRNNESALICAVLPTVIPGYHHARLLAIEELQGEIILDETKIQRDLRSWLPALLCNATLAEQACQEHEIHRDTIETRCCEQTSYESSYYLHRRYMRAFHRTTLPPGLSILFAQVRAESDEELAAHAHFSLFLRDSRSKEGRAREVAVLREHSDPSSLWPTERPVVGSITDLMNLTANMQISERLVEKFIADHFVRNFSRRADVRRRAALLEQDARHF